MNDPIFKNKSNLFEDEKVWMARCIFADQGFPHICLC